MMLWKVKNRTRKTPWTKCTNWREEGSFRSGKTGIFRENRKCFPITRKSGNILYRVFTINLSGKVSEFENFRVKKKKKKIKIQHNRLLFVQSTKKVTEIMIIEVMIEERWLLFSLVTTIVWNLVTTIVWNNWYIQKLVLGTTCPMVWVVFTFYIYLIISYMCVSYS